MTLKELHSNLVDTSKQVTALKAQNQKLEEEIRSSKTDISHLKLTVAKISKENKHIKSVIQAVRKEK